MWQLMVVLTFDDEIILSLGVISGLIFLFCAGWIETPVLPTVLGPAFLAQHLLLRIVNQSFWE